MKTAWARRKGFTIVELLIVIVVIGILAAITIVAYSGFQDRSNDSKTKSAANQIEKAIRLYAIDNGNVILGGSGSTTAVGANGCSNGGNGWFSTGTYTCTAEETLVAARLLPAGLTKSLAINNQYSSTLPTDGRLSVMLYTCGAGKYALYWTLRSASSDDTSKLMSTLSTCGHAAANFRDSYGMRSGSVISLE